jgi:cytochrome c6
MSSLAHKLTTLCLAVIAVYSAAVSPTFLKGRVAPKSVATIFACLQLASPIISPHWAIAAEDRFIRGAQLFTQNCALCHKDGGNVLPFVQDKTLFANALKENGYEKVGDIAEIVTNGHGLMPGLQSRLSEEESRIVSEYVRHQADKNWGK